MRRLKSYSSDEIALEIARHRVDKIKRFYKHLFIYTVAISLYVAKTYFGAPFNFWPIHFVNNTFMAVWTFIIAIQGLRLFFRESFFGTDWEHRKIQEYMSKETRNKFE